MLFNLRRSLVAAAVCLSVSSVAQAAVATFETGADANFSYIGVEFGSAPYVTGSGYDNVAAATSSTGFAYNYFEASPASFLIGGAPTNTFTLNSFVIAGAWGSQTLGLEGLNDGVTLFSGSLFVSTTATTYNANWAGIDQLRISIGGDFVDHPDLVITGQHWALDNLTYNNTAPIPEPETYAMLLAGLGLLGFAARRRKLKESAAA